MRMKVSEASFEMLKKFGKGYWATFDKLNSFEDFEIHLNQFIASGAYFYEGRVADARQLVEKIGAIKIEIYPNEHTPPHFHIKSNGLNASFAIDDCRLLENSGFSTKVIKNIQDWFLHSKEKLIDVWNQTRPDDCVVGKII
jgi:hypothetical protein